jgi:hypothetical protein
MIEKSAASAKEVRDGLAHCVQIGTFGEYFVVAVNGLAVAVPTPEHAKRLSDKLLNVLSLVGFYETPGVIPPARRIAADLELSATIGGRVHLKPEYAREIARVLREAIGEEVPR